MTALSVPMLLPDASCWLRMLDRMGAKSKKKEAPSPQ
jgi:hypothetical protein